MKPPPLMLNAPETQSVLSMVLRQLHGADARLQNWTACPASKRGKHRTVRYDLEAQVAGEPRVRKYQWAGKFCERDEDARKLAAILRELGAANGCASGGLVIPSVLAYHAPLRLLLLNYEPGQTVVSALAQHNGLVLAAIGRGLAALHAAPVTHAGTTSPADLLCGLRKKVAQLCARFPSQGDLVRGTLNQLEREAPAGPASLSFLHGDLGPVQLLWSSKGGGRLVVLDFDKCARGDPALDLGNLLTQLRRLTLRKPGKLGDFATLRQGLLEAYQRWSPPDPGLTERVAWYEQMTLLRKIRFLASNTGRHPDAEALQRRQAEAVQLLNELAEECNAGRMR